MCVVNHTFGFIAVHIPKCAGTSTTHALAPLTTYADIELGGTEYGEALHKIMGPRFNLTKHSFASEIRAVVGVEKWVRYYTFSFVRNPYARAYSTYTYLRAHKAAYPMIRPFETFEDFVMSKAWDGPGPDRMLQPQLYWLRRGPKSDDVIVDFVGKVETYRPDLQHALKSIGLGPDKRKALPVRRLNESGGRRGKPAITEAMAERIKTRYAEDFAAFGYETSPPEGWAA